MPRAIQFGMSIQDFWHGDLDLISAYEKAYYNHLYQSAYIQGIYVNSAFSIAYNNAWNKGNKKEYGKEIEMVDIIVKLNEKKAEQNAIYKKQKANYLNEKYQKQNFNWI